jgi:hypothetical protein
VFVQPIASWLVARPQNAILGLAATLMLPFAQLFSGAVMALLVLHQGPAKSALHAVIASALLVVISLIVKTSAIQILANGLVTWLPVLLLASLLRHWRSLALTLQVSVIAAVVIMLAFYAAVPDPTAFWKSVLNEMALVFAQMELQGQADILLTQQDVIAPQMTILVVFTSWSLYVAVLLLGYALMQTLPGQSHCFGRFADLGLGRVLAITMAIVSLTAMASGANWLQNIAFLLFAVFWIQGLAMAHWLHAEKRLPGIAVVLVYVLLPVLNLLMVLGLAVAGYVDAWFGFRQRVTKQNG